MTPISDNPSSIQLTSQLDSKVEGQELLDDLFNKAREFAEAGISENTRRSYKNDWTHFAAWCQKVGLVECPAEHTTICLYITELAHGGFSVATIRRRMATITKYHRIAQFPSPVDNEQVRTIFSGIRRTLGVAQNKKKALLTADIQAMLAHLPDKLIGVRDRALLLLGFVLFNRRSELARISVGDLEFGDQGVMVWIRSSKTDQEGKGKCYGIHFGQHQRTCPVLALQQWLTLADITDGPAFRHGNVGENPLHDGSIARIIKRYAVKAGLNPADYSGHSLRRGGITTAIMNGASIPATMKHSRHANMDSFQGYVQEARIWSENITSRLGL